MLPMLCRSNPFCLKKNKTKLGTVIESTGNDQYIVRLHGSNRVTLRNRKFLRRINYKQGVNDRRYPRTATSPEPQNTPNPQINTSRTIVETSTVVAPTETQTMDRSDETSHNDTQDMYDTDVIHPPSKATRVNSETPPSIHCLTTYSSPSVHERSADDATDVTPSMQHVDEQSVCLEKTSKMAPRLCHVDAETPFTDF